MDQIQLECGGIELLERVKPLWKKLNSHHLSHSVYFKQHYMTFTFDVRQQRFLEDTELKVMVNLAYDLIHQRDVGYCISSINLQGIGEVESIYIEAEYRKLALGDQFMKRAMNWMDAQQVTSRMISVAEGNEEVFAFYQRYGFFPRKTILEFIPPEHKD